MRPLHPWIAVPHDGRAPSAHDANARKGVWHLRRWLAPYTRQVVLALACAVGSAAAAVLVPVVVSRVIVDELLLHTDRGDAPSYAQAALTRWLAAALHVPALASACSLILLWGAVWASLGYVFRAQLSYAANAALSDLRRDLFSHVGALPASFFDRTSVGQVLTSTTNDIESLSELALGMGMLIGEVVPFAVAATVMLSLDSTLSAELTPVLALGALAISVFRRASRSVYAHIRDRAADLNAHLHENLSGIESVQLAGREALNLQRFERLNEGVRASEAAAIRLETMYNPTMECIPNLTLACILWFGGWHVLRGQITLGTVVLFLQFSDMLVRPVIAIGDQASSVFRASAACSRIFQLFECTESLARIEPARALPAKLRGDIEYRDLSFRYPGSDSDVIAQLTLKVKAGETLAIVGPTGSGKTTLTRLLCRLYDAPTGSVFVDDIDVMTVEPAQLRKRVGVILQDFHIFPGTVYDNIALGNPAVTREVAAHAAGLVHALGFIDALAHGFDTLLDDGGHNLSHGQRQLLAFARVLALAPDILILDEATASIDPETEAAIQVAISHAVSHRTAIIVAHRLQTVRAAHQIAVLERGRLVELGNHHELLQLRGLYWKLHELQARSSSVQRAH